MIQKSEILASAKISSHSLDGVVGWPSRLYNFLPHTYNMPKEHRKRGRREEKKRKREDEEQEDTRTSSKRQKSGEPDDELKIYEGIGQTDESPFTSGPGELQFYGLLDEDEQEYFKRADSMLEVNQFADSEERDLFLANVYKEANGKELKIANSQSCSRLMERLILLSTPSQLKNLFQKFSGQCVSFELELIHIY